MVWPDVALSMILPSGHKVAWGSMVIFGILFPISFQAVLP